MRQMHGIKRRWLLNNIGIIAFILCIAVVVFTVTVYYFYLVNLSDMLVARAETSRRLFLTYISDAGGDFHESALRYTEDFVDKDKMEFEVIHTSGYVLCSSTSELLTGFIPGTPDVSEALSMQITRSYSGADKVTGQRVMSVTTPVIQSSGETVCAIRYVTALSAVNDSVTAMCLIAAAVCGMTFVFVLMSNLYFIRSIVRPLHELNEITKQIAAGEYGVTIEKKFDDEIGELADSISFMSGEINRSAMIKNDFISSVSHELRTPLTAITGWTETLKGSELAQGRIESRGLEVISKESQRLREMVEELLDFSRIESGRLVINRAQMELKTELEDTIIMYEQRLKQDGLHVVYNDELGETESAVISGDRSRLRQVFVNIMDNARKYSESGSTIDITIDEETQPQRGYSIVFADHGAGISETDLPHVKEKFYKGSANKPGSGIGLAVSDEIILLHGGTLTVASKLGEGTQVTVFLPKR